MTAPRSTPRGLPAWGRYSVALAAVVVAAVARWALIPFLGPTQLPYTSFFLAAVLGAWWVRMGPALLALVLGVAVGNWLFVPPPGGFALDAPEGMRMAAFMASSLAAIVAIEAIHRANARAVAELAERRRSEEALAGAARRQETLYRFAERLQRGETLEELYQATLDAILG